MNQSNQMEHRHGVCVPEGSAMESTAADGQCLHCVYGKCLRKTFSVANQKETLSETRVNLRGNLIWSIHTVVYKCRMLI